jgi:adenosylcobinamide kinase/adenosylcobinamide-phosphate guanylyltransferase
VGELVLVLGGTRSGKSRYAADRARKAGGDRVTFIATARPGDPDLDERIAAHRRSRPPAWATIDAGPELADAISTARAADVVLLDSITLWLSAGASVSGAEIAARLDRAVAALRARDPGAIVVSDEVGMGVVPMTAEGRVFRDRLGALAQRLAREADEVVLLIAGLPLTLKAAG